MGEVVYVELPKAGDQLDANDTFGTVESVKAVSELFMPVSGEVIEVNDALDPSPELVNDDAYGKGWMIRIRMRDQSELKNLISPDEYAEYTSGFRLKTGGIVLALHSEFSDRPRRNAARNRRWWDRRAIRRNSR